MITPGVRGLHVVRMTGPCRCVIIDTDEEKARSGQIGSLTHRLLHELLSTSRHPSHELVDVVVHEALRRFARVEGRAHRQTLVANLCTYLWWMLPDPQWRYVGAELHLGAGRVDLAWADESDRIMFDEVKTGSTPVQVMGVRRQVTAYRDAAKALHGPRFTGIRVLSLRDPRSSWWLPAQGEAGPLLLTMTTGPARAAARQVG